MRGRRNTAKPRICRQVRSRSAAVPLPPPPLRGRVGVGGPRVPLPPKSTNPISTKCTAPNRCLIARTARPRANLHAMTQPQAAEAKSSSPPTRANPAPNSAPPRAQPAALRGIAVGGRRGESRSLAEPPPDRTLSDNIALSDEIFRSNQKQCHKLHEPNLALGGGK